MFLASYEDRLDMVVTNAWEIWTNNGLGLDDEDCVETEKTVRDAATNVYVEGMDDGEWLDATLARLGAEDNDERERGRYADRIDGYDRDDLGESPDY
jgi:hypothetical protein